jgi:hypothetical protein
LLFPQRHDLAAPSGCLTSSLLPVRDGVHGSFP